MARDHAQVNIGIWEDDEWRALPPAAQHLYLTLWTSPHLSYCGVLDWRPGRVASLAGGWTAEAVETAASCLEARYFIVVDRVTEELLVRSWIRFDGLMKQPRMAVSMTNALTSVYSNDIRGVIVYELQKLKENQPNLAGWNHDKAAELLTREALNPRERTLPEDPFGGSFGGSFGPSLGVGLDPVNPKQTPNVSGSPTPFSFLPTPYSSTPFSKEDAPRRPHQLPDGWNPDKDVIDAMHEECPNVDLKAEHRKFADHWQGTGKPMKDWNAVWRNWIRRSTNFTSPTSRRATNDIDWDAAADRAAARDRAAS